MSIKVSHSILSADFANLEKDCQMVMDVGADLVSFHLESDSDVMETINIIRSCGKMVKIHIQWGCYTRDVENPNSRFIFKWFLWCIV